MAVSSAKSGPEQAKPKAGYPPRDFKFLAMNLAVTLIPTGWKFWANRILLKTSISDSAPISLPEQYKWTWAGPEEIEFVDRHPEATSPTANVRRAAKGDRCLCIKTGPEVACYQWVTRRAACLRCGFGDKMEINVFPLRPGQAFTYDLFTYEKHRHHGIALLLRKLLFHTLREEGIQEVFNLVSPKNHAVLRLHARLGAQPQRMVYSYRIRGWSKTFLGPEGDTRLTEWMQQIKSTASGT